ncbi:MAG TPA: alpha-amylase family glycosyl hydrolase [Chitinophagaceae bacterium]|nr:alpha-amylase family glycosyl hydrolase [Chitinophagaceae bacterium]
MADTKDWIRSTNVYEVNVRQYTTEGTFNAFARHLPRLRSMGVHTLWFMPVTPIAQKNKKGSMGSPYAAADYTSINPEFGTLDDFKRLVQEAHAQGFKVIIDWVANHTGWDHRWTVEHPGWYEHDSATGTFKIASGMDDIIELDFGNREMRRAMIDAMKFWVTETGIDGFRCDLAFWVELDFWLEAKKELDTVKPLFWLAELDPLDHPDYMQVFDAAYTWTWMHKAREWYQNRQPVSVLDSVLQRYQQAPGFQAWFTTNHDENSWNGTEYEKYGEAAKALAVLSATWPGIPLLYSGQEQPNHKRLEFFEKDPIQWTGEPQLHEFYKTLLNLHALHPALLADAQAAPVQRLHLQPEVLAYKRSNGEREVVVLLNLSGQMQGVNVGSQGITGTYRNPFTGETADFQAHGDLRLQPWQYLVFEK